MEMKVSSVISVSRREELDCVRLARLMSKAGIMTSVTSNISTTPEIENGCRMVQSIKGKDDIERIWGILKSEYGFRCAHVRVGDQYDGCILDYLVETRCSR